MNEEEAAASPFKDTDKLPAIGKTLAGLKFVQVVDVLDCLGCGNCVDVCPGKKNRETGEVEKALKMVPLLEHEDDQKLWDYASKHVTSKQALVDIKSNVKNSQFATPLFEFNGACSGCGETPYVKLISQLFGDREMVSNATGCSSIYSAAVPSTPYCTNEKGHGPAWANSLFEDFCEFGMGMAIADEKMRARVKTFVQEAIASEAVADDIKALYNEWLENFNDGPKSRELSDKILAAISNSDVEENKNVLSLGKYLVKRSQWIIGGDGASYDIGYGGLDHVIGSGEDVNIFVIDTEVYSNTGGQASKATPIGAIAQFAANGKRVGKKDLGLMQATYGNVYVAQVAMGADQSQCLKAFREAEAWHGPSLIIGYAPCINHGLKAKGGMGKSQAEEAKAVECGYWHLWRNNPALAAEGKNPFQLDSKEPDWDKFQNFLEGEVRFLSLKKAAPAEAQELYDACKEAAKRRYKTYIRKTQEDWSLD